MKKGSKAFLGISFTTLLIMCIVIGFQKKYTVWSRPDIIGKTYNEIVREKGMPDSCNKIGIQDARKFGYEFRVGMLMQLEHEEYDGDTIIECQWNGWLINEIVWYKYHRNEIMAFDDLCWRRGIQF
jgi:hypothetical protein